MMLIVLPGHYTILDEELNEDGYVGATLGILVIVMKKWFRTLQKKRILDQVEKSASSVKQPNV